MITKLLAVLLVASASPAFAGYRVTTIDGPASPALLGTVVDGINDHGLTTGYYVLGGDPSQGQPPQTYVGFTANTDGSNFTSFGRTGYQQTGVSGINNAGTTVGVSVATYGSGNAFVRSAGGAFTDLVPTFNGVASAYSEAISINDAGTIVGFYTDVVPPSIAAIQDYAHGFILSGGVYTKFDLPGIAGIHGTELFGINSHGFISGSILDGSADDLPHGFIFDPHSGLTLPAVGNEAASSVGGINDRGDFGYAALSADPLSPTGFDATPYVNIGGAFTALHVPGAFSAEIEGINNHDDVTGYYLDATGAHGFVAQAIPEPASWVLMIAGFGMTGLIARARSRSAVAA